MLRRAFLKTLFLGWSALRQPMVLRPQDRAIHMHVIGSSGSGKSKFLEWIIRGDIRNRQGLCLIDPHGELYDNIVRWCAYKGYAASREIALFNPSAGDQVLGFNPFVRAPSGDISVQVDRRITATVKAWNVQNTDQTPTLERMLRLIYHTIIEKNLTIVEAQYLINFHVDQVTRYLTSGIGSEIIANEWRELRALKTPAQWRDEVRSTKNRLLRFLCNDQVVRFMGLTQHNLDLAEMVEGGKILVVNLAESDHLSSINARLFGALLVNEFYEVAKRRRQDSRGRAPSPYYLYIDEFQHYVTDLGDMLDQVRKRGLFLILAHQRFGQLSDELIDAVLTNCRIKAVFGGLRRQDAQRMVEEMFVGQLDLKEIKKAIYQTKFWPQYSRDKVRAHGWGGSSGSVESSGLSLASGTATGEAEGWFENGPVTQLSSSTSASVRGTSSSDSWSEAEIDIPIFVPVPFKEPSSLEYWSREDQVWRMSDSLMKQFPRHCFIKIAGQKTQPMLVPRVPDYSLSPRIVLQYQQRLNGKQNALPRHEVDALIQDRQRKLLEQAQAHIEATEGRPHGQPTQAVLWNRTGAGGLGTLPTQSSPRKRGPKPDLQNHAKVARIISSYGDAWTTDESLAEICEKLDQARVPVPKKWPTRWDGKSHTWRRGFENYPHLVVKAIRDRLKGAASASEPPQTSAGS